MPVNMPTVVWVLFLFVLWQESCEDFFLWIIDEKTGVGSKQLGKWKIWGLNAGKWLQKSYFLLLLYCLLIQASFVSKLSLNWFSRLQSCPQLSILCTVAWKSFHNWKTNHVIPLLKPFNYSSLFLEWGPNLPYGPQSLCNFAPS